MLRLLAITFAASVLALPGARAQDLGNADRGHAFAKSLCASCHAVEADEVASPNPSAPSFARIAAEPGMTGMALMVILTNPHRQMPNLILKRDDLHDFAAYILTLTPAD